MTKTGWNEYYEKTKTPPWATKKSFNEAKKCIDCFIKDHNESSKKRVLDFGCGTSPYYADYFIKKGYEVICIDISDTAINKRVAQNNATNLSFSNISELGSRFMTDEGRFDIIFCWGVFHHIYEDERKPILSLFKDILKEDGMMIISGWDEKSDNFSENGIRLSKELDGEQTYAIDQIESLFRGNFLEEISSGSYWHTDHFPMEEEPKNKKPENKLMKFYILKFDLEFKSLIEKVKSNNSILFFHDVNFYFESIFKVELKKDSVIWLKDKSVVEQIYKNGLRNLPKNASLTKTLYEKQSKKKNIHILFRPAIDSNIVLEQKANQYNLYEAEVALPINESNNARNIVTDNDFDFYKLSDILESVENTDSNNLSQFQCPNNNDFLEKDVRGVICNFFYNKENCYWKSSFHFYVFMHKMIEVKQNDKCAAFILIVSYDELSKEMFLDINNRYMSWCYKKTLSIFGNFSRQEAVKQSISQVMARNLSHNIGSHVFSNLIDDKNINIKIKPNQKTIPYKPKDNDNNLLNKSKQLVYFNRYLKSRMDYLSEVTFGVANILTTKRVYYDTFLELDRVRILLNYISGISDFKYKFKLSSNSTELDETNDLLVAFPSDLLGCQAFYNIVENIIRNTAKYNKQNTQEITFNININDVIYLDGYVQGLPSEYNQYYAVEIDDGINVNKIDELVTKQNMRLNESILGDEQRLRKHSLGLLEMEASAAFLRQIDLHEIESDDYNISQNTSFFNYKMNLNILKAFKANGNALGYRFFIKKPQEFLFVVDLWQPHQNPKKFV